MGAGRRRPFLGWALLVLAATPWLGSGCGYHLGYPRDPQVQTVHVSLFENRTGRRTGGARRELEIELQRAVIQELQRRTPYRIVARAGEADAAISGTLERVSERVAVEGADDQVLRTSVAFRVRVRVARPGRVDLRADLTEADELTPRSGRLGTAPEVLAPAAREAFRRVAERIAMMLEG